MTVPAALPGGRELAGWQRELADWKPRRLWIADLLVHVVDALVAVRRPVQLDFIARAILRDLGSVAGPLALDSLSDRLLLDSQLLRRVLRELHVAGLVEPGSDGRWLLTAHGRGGLPGTDWLAAEPVRRSFQFVDNGDGGVPPHFIRIDPPARGQQVAPPAGWSFAPESLLSCVARPQGWKQAHRFPEDVTSIHVDAGNWRTLLIDRPERVALVLIEVEDDRLLGFCGKADGHILGQPVLQFAAEPARDVLPELRRWPTADEWRQAWAGQAAGLGLGGADAQRCEFEPHTDRLILRAPSAVVARLRGRAAWISAAAGRLRPALPVELVVMA